MKVVVRYLAQIKQAAGRAEDVLNLAGPRSPAEVIAQIARQNQDTLRSLLLNASGDVQATLLLFVNDQQVDPLQPADLREGDILTILAPMAGG